MLSMLATLKATYFLSSQGQKWWGNETLEETNKRRNWDNNDYIYRGHILKGMVYSLFGIYNQAKSENKMWDTLESKYMDWDASSKKFLVNDLNK